MSNLVVRGTTISGSSNFGLLAISISGSQIENTEIMDSDGTGVQVSGGGLRLIHCRIEANGDSGIGLSYASTVLLGGGGQPGHNVVMNNGGHGLNAYASSANLGEAGTVANPDGYAGYNSIYGNAGKDVFADGGSSIKAEENWWGESPPNTGHFHVSSTSSLDYSPWLTSDPNAGTGKGGIYSSHLESISPLTRTDEQAGVPSTRGNGVDAGRNALTAGAFVARIQALRDERGRAHSAAVLSEIASTQGDPMSNVAQVLRLGDLLYLRRAHEVVGIGEALMAKRQVLDEQATKIVAQALLTAYEEHLDDEANAARMKGLLAELGDLEAVDETLAPQTESHPSNDDARANDPATVADAGLQASSYPNPFNPEVTIQYSLQQKAPVLLRVFDVLGRPVATLVDEVKQPGQHQVRLVASDLPSGIYLYRIEAAEHIVTGRLVLQK